MKDNDDTIVNPIYDWSDQDVWEYIRQEHIKVNVMYEKGYTRVGCIGCPLAAYHQRVKEFQDYPKYKQLYINAFEKMIRRRKDRNLKCVWENGQAVFDWWLEVEKHEVKGQLSLFEDQE